MFGAGYTYNVDAVDQAQKGHLTVEIFGSHLFL